MPDIALLRERLARNARSATPLARLEVDVESLTAVLAAVSAQTGGHLADVCQSEGPRGETICMRPLGHDGPCGWERSVQSDPVKTPFDWQRVSTHDHMSGAPLVDSCDGWCRRQVERYQRQSATPAQPERATPLYGGHIDRLIARWREAESYYRGYSDQNEMRGQPARADVADARRSVLRQCADDLAALFPGAANPQE